jgi:hypothetical protein
MILTLHNLAEAYKVLPSEALVRASTFDLYVLDCHFRYVKYQEQRAKAQGEGLPPPSKKLTQEQMKAMIAEVRNNPRKIKKERQ